MQMFIKTFQVFYKLSIRKGFLIGWMSVITITFYYLEIILAAPEIPREIRSPLFFALETSTKRSL